MDTQSDVPDVGKLVIDELQRHAETVASVSRDFLKSERHRMLEVEKKLETLATEHRNRLSLLANAPTDDSTPPVSSDAELAQSASDEVGGSVPLAGHIPHPPDADGARRRKSTLTFQLPPEERYKQGERSFSSFLAFDSLISASRKGGARNEIHSVVPVSRDTYERHRRRRSLCEGNVTPTAFGCHRIRHYCHECRVDPNRDVCMGGEETYGLGSVFPCAVDAPRFSRTCGTGGSVLEMGVSLQIVGAPARLYQAPVASSTCQRATKERL